MRSQLLSTPTLASPILAALLLAAACAPAQADDLDLPAAIEFGAGLEALTPAFDTLCESYDVRTLDPAELPIAETSHVQIDCQGFDHAGAERLAEFVFADDQLAFIWVLTEASEESGHLSALSNRFGAPTHDTAGFVAWADDHVALRRDIPEFLYYGEAVAPMYRGWFDQMAG
ncbi:hypothetical protein [Maricaulis parjimensis]|uniref:hypothetical protein n=1 Tax=Maricaulis parjimensis TaxID=144023 RepID=UPI001939332B|nr:hypothetical protein [Maricaulis parjimensis]